MIDSRVRYGGLRAIRPFDFDRIDTGRSSDAEMLHQRMLAAEGVAGNEDPDILATTPEVTRTLAFKGDFFASSLNPTVIQ